MANIANLFVQQAILNTIGSEGLAHFKRPRGSFLPILREQGEAEGQTCVDLLLGLAEADTFVEVEAGEAGFGKCRYFRSACEGGREAVALLDELNPAELASVRIQAGHHGTLELVSDTVEAKPTDVLHICIGDGKDPFTAPTDETATVYTWYPGRLTAPVQIGKASVKLG